MLKTLFPTRTERYSIGLPGSSGSIKRADAFGPAVLLGGALRLPDYAKTSGMDASLLAQLGGSGAGASGERQTLKKVTSVWGPLMGGDNSHAVAGVGRSIKVGNSSVVEASGSANVQAGSNTTVSLSGTLSNNVRVGDSSLVLGGGGRDMIFGGHNAVVRGGDGDDYISVKDGSIVTGDGGNDTIIAGRYSIIDGVEGNNTITAGAGSTVTGGKGNDTITVERASTDKNTYDPAKIVGGQGDDVITIRNTAADIEYRRGDGSDIIRGDLGESTLTLVGLRQNEVGFTLVQTGSGSYDMIVTINGSDDTITIKNADSVANANFSISFRGGSEVLLGEKFHELLAAQPVF
ncbi:calcium-binding protein [Telmatospirillum sp. J64-1]|uniref:calcium-binding protein n=1 Tax=Telmatospirillum sp. J64-1 TaxID=2502183 RepID=UPI00115DC32B|nr:calcium-binding protein [Telmatospirillum sp. J64-1]